MNEREERMYRIGKADILVGRMVQQMYLLIAVASVSGIGGSVASEILDILPRWANIVVGTGGVLNLPGSVVALPKMEKWIREADIVMENFEIEHGIKPPKNNTSL